MHSHSANDIHEVLGVIKGSPGLRTSQIVERIKLPLRSVESAIWELWRDGKIQMEPDSTLRVTRDDEKVFRHFAP
jgi:Mn-dependent DtxR family transcriptional regulator